MTSNLPPGARGLYTAEQKRIVREQYRYCITREDKMELARRVGLDSLEGLYNLANRLGVTRAHQEDEESSPAFAPERLRLREDPSDLSFTEREDEYIRRRFGRMKIEELAFHLDHTESAIMVRARHLGLRRHCKYWEARKVAAWLDLSVPELISRGIDVFACADTEDMVRVVLVSATSLLRARPEDISGPRPDAFFLAEIADLRARAGEGDVGWEVSRWVSHGHQCLNPWSGVSFGLFDDGSDLKMPARDLRPDDVAVNVPMDHIERLALTRHI